MYKRQSIFSVLDLSQGFFQQSLVDPQEATSFSIPGYGQFTYCRSPQGLNSSPAYFQRLLDHVLSNISRVYVYIDDIVISVNSHEENLERLEAVFARFRQHNLKVKPSKCHIGTGAITCDRSSADMAFGWLDSVSYTHLTLPTNREV